MATKPLLDATPEAVEPDLLKMAALEESQLMATNDEAYLLRVSRVVHERRAALGLTQEQLAEVTGLHRTYISDIERGARNLSIKSLMRLAEAMGVEASELLKRAEES